MSNIETLQEIYRQKQEEGLIHVGFTYAVRASGADAETLAGEAVRLCDAVKAGNFRTLRFNDGTLTEDQKAAISADIAARRAENPEWPKPSQAEFDRITAALDQK